MRILTVLAGMFAALAASAASADTVRVGAAVSLKDAFADIAKAYAAETGDSIEFVYGSSGQVAAQIKNGADLDVFVSAAQKQVDELEKAGKIDTSTKRVICGNTLVLVVPAKSTFEATSADQLKPEAITRLAIGEPKSVPAGQYAAEALKTLKFDGALKGKLVYGTNVRQVVTYVERNEVTAGIVYGSDAKSSDDKVKVAFTFDANVHSPIVYPAIAVSGRSNPAAAKKFLDYLAGEKAKAALASHGFTLPQPAAKS